MPVLRLDRYASLSNNTPSHSRHENLSEYIKFNVFSLFFFVVKKQMGKAEKDSEREGGGKKMFEGGSESFWQRLVALSRKHHC